MPHNGWLPVTSCLPSWMTTHWTTGLIISFTQQGPTNKKECNFKMTNTHVRAKWFSDVEYG